jgi:gamma-glutamylcyclotransferase (GGCT)/AIG2-like uncharacterized protein YtfP
VHGELIAIQSADLIKALDVYEDYDPNDPAGSLYLRVRADTLDGSTHVWTYQVNRPTNGFPVISSGDWRLR